MSYTHRIIISCCLLFAPAAQAVDAFADLLYWRATETVDWSLNNSLNASNQQITYNTIKFDFTTGFRAGVGYDAAWHSKLYYTYFYTHANSSVTGNIVSAFLGGKAVQTAGGGIFFYRSGQVSFKINFQTLDLDFGKTFNLTPALMVRPIIGLRAGQINQTINTSFIGSTSANEFVVNNFKGIGPKAAVESKWKIYTRAKWQYNIFADFTSAYLCGKWSINDVVHDTAGLTIYTRVGSRRMGAFVLQALMGVNIKYCRCNLKLGYEISDWFDQYQVLDDGTGARNCDLVLQGLTLRLQYCF